MTYERSSVRFGGQKGKESTARVCLFNELEHVPAVYTLEASFSGTPEGVFYTPDILKSIGRDMCRALIPYCGLNVPFPMPSRPHGPTSEKTLYFYAPTIIIATRTAVA